MRIQLSNVGVINKCDIEFVPGINLIIGASGSGKSTLIRSIYNIVSNEFADSDISFGKNSMSINVDNNGNKVEYHRSIKFKGEKCYYSVNGEQYVKLGRQPLQAVTNVLKIGDVDVNGENINFNFNLQFSSPFLILGSQSTLYNVLTYRSSFDISSINDYYNIDVKNNANELVTNLKLKERLESNLNQLEDSADKISSIETVYSNYITYKHNLARRDELAKLLEKIELCHKATNGINDTSEIINHINTASSLIYELKEISKYRSMSSSLNEICNRTKSCKNMADQYESAMKNVQLMMMMNDMLYMMNQSCKISDSLKLIDKCLESSNRLLHNEQFINDIVKQHQLTKKYNRSDRITQILSKSDTSIINKIDDVLHVANKLNDLLQVNSSLSNVELKSKDICDEINQFNACPLCGQPMHNHKEKRLW